MLVNLLHSCFRDQLLLGTGRLWQGALEALSLITQLQMTYIYIRKKYLQSRCHLLKEMAAITQDLAHPTVVGDWAVFPPLRGTGILAYNPITRIQKSLYFNGEDFEISNPEEATNFSSAATLGKWAIFAPQSASASLAYDPVENVYHKFYNEPTEGYTMSTTVNDEWVVQYPNTADSFASIKIADPTFLILLISYALNFESTLLFTVDTLD